MKVHSFHLMPYPYLPDDFEKQYHSVYIDIPSKLYDPELGHRAYNDYLDELELAASLGFDGVCMNEHHYNAYGLMPSPNIMAATLARRTKDVAIVVLGNSIVLHNPPTRIAEEFAMLDVISGGRVVAGFPLGTAMDTNYRLRPDADHAARQVPRGARPHRQGVDGAGALRLERQVHPAALREHLAASRAEAAPADLDPRRQLAGDLGVGH